MKNKRMKTKAERVEKKHEYIKAFNKNNHLRLSAAVFLRILGIPAMLIVSFVLGEVIDAVSVMDMNRLHRLLWMAGAAIIFFAVQETLYHRLLSAYIKRALSQYKSYAFKRLSAKGISAFSKESTGRYLSVLTNDVTVIEKDYLRGFFELIAQPLTFAATLAMMFSYSIALTAAAILLCFLPFLGIALFSPELAKREKALSDKNENFTSKLNDLLSGFSVIKSFKAETEAALIFDEENRSAEQVRSRRLFWQGLLEAAGGSLSMLMQFGIFFIGAYLAVRGHITAGVVLIFTNLSNSLIVSVQMIPQNLAQRKAAKVLIEKMAKIAEENSSRSGETIEPVLNDSISIENLTFGYEPGKPVLHDLSLRLEAGKKYAIVGSSGSGKSTLLNLLMGSGDDYEGHLRFDGRELRDIAPDSLYELMSLIGQNVFLFDDTIRRNITMFRDFPQKVVDNAISRAGLKELIRERGVDYRCGENGSGLSGGERQRISIARCLLRRTPVLLLDEATASLDNQTAFAVTESILELEGLTRLIVTHRLDRILLEKYDEIFVLRDGRMIEQGTFDNLMDRKGYFYSLYTIGSSDYL